MAATDGYLDLMTFFLDLGVSPNDRFRGLPALAHAVCWAPTSNCAKALLMHGADVNALTDKGTTALHFAAHGEMPEKVALLLDFGANVEICNSSGRTVFDVAKPKCKALLEAHQKKQAEMKK